MIGVAIVHQDPLVIRGLRQLLDESNELTAVGSAASWGTTDAIGDDGTAQVVFTELGLCRASHAIVRRTLARGVKLVAQGTRRDADGVVEAMSYGAIGYVHRSCLPERVVSGLSEVAKGRAFIDLGRESSTPPVRSRAEDEHLTRREKEVLRLMLLRRSNLEIAEQLCVSHQTVKNYSSQVFRKIGVTGRVELLRRLSANPLPDESGIRITAAARHLPVARKPVSTRGTGCV